MFKRSKEQEKKGSEKREDLLVSFLKDAHFVFAIIFGLKNRNICMRMSQKLVIDTSSCSDSVYEATRGGIGCIGWG